MKSLIVCSGGLDSACMAAIKSTDCEITLMNFNYGQKATSEIYACREIAKILGCEIVNIDVSALSNIFGKTQLTDNEVEIENEYQKNVIVPLRNALFCQIAMIYASSNNFDEIVLGSHTDDIGVVDGEMMYPDCSPQFFKAFEEACALGKFKSDKRVRIESASTLGLSKSQLIKNAAKINPKILSVSWSCYYSNEKQCGICESCMNRKKAFQKSLIQDETEYYK